MRPLLLVLTVLQSLRALGRSRSDLLLENVALRQRTNPLIQDEAPSLAPAERAHAGGAAGRILSPSYSQRPRRLGIGRHKGSPWQFGPN